MLLDLGWSPLSVLGCRCRCRLSLGLLLGSYLSIYLATADSWSRLPTVWVPSVGPHSYRSLASFAIKLCPLAIRGAAPEVWHMRRTNPLSFINCVQKARPPSPSRTRRLAIWPQLSSGPLLHVAAYLAHTCMRIGGGKQKQDAKLINGA